MTFPKTENIVKRWKFKSGLKFSFYNLIDYLDCCSRPRLFPAVSPKSAARERNRGDRGKYRQRKSSEKIAKGVKKVKVSNLYLNYEILSTFRSNFYQFLFSAFFEKRLYQLWQEIQIVLFTCQLRKLPMRLKTGLSSLYCAREVFC